MWPGLRKIVEGSPAPGSASGGGGAAATRDPSNAVPMVAGGGGGGASVAGILTAAGEIGQLQSGADGDSVFLN